MKRFHFSLETLLELRLRRENDIKRRLGDKRREIVEAKQKMVDLGAELKEIQEQELERRATNVSLGAMRATVLYRFKLKSDMLKNGQVIDILYNQAEVIQQELTKAMQQRKALEMLRDKRKSDWKKDALRTQQNQIDDIAQQGYIRKLHKGVADHAHA